MKFWYYAIRCWLGNPVVYLDWQDNGDWYYAMCRNCNRQTEVHEFGGPTLLPILEEERPE